MDVQVTQVRYEGETTAMGVGFDVATGDRVLFAGDWRPMLDIAGALSEGIDDVVADVPDWAVLYRVSEEDR